MENHRLSREEALREIVLITSRRSTCPRRSVGAILVREGRILSSGYNGAPSGLPHCDEGGCEIGPDGGCVRTVHAEQNAIAFAARQGVRVEGASLWTTVSPCISCAKLIINAGIIEVVSLETYRDVFPMELLRRAGVVSRMWETRPAVQLLGWWMCPECNRWGFPSIHGPYCTACGNAKRGL